MLKTKKEKLLQVFLSILSGLILIGIGVLGALKGQTDSMVWLLAMAVSIVSIVSIVLTQAVYYRRW